MIYLCFLGAAVCCRRGSLIKVDVVHDLLPPKAARALEEAVNLVSAVFLCFALYSCCKYLPLGFNSDASSMKGIRMFWFYLSMPLGLGMTLLNLVANTYERWKGGGKGMSAFIYICLLLCFVAGVPIACWAPPAWRPLPATPR